MTEVKGNRTPRNVFLTRLYPQILSFRDQKKVVYGPIGYSLPRDVAPIKQISDQWIKIRIEHYEEHFLLK